ncbi:MAG TPA: hypothetical protein VFQ35_26120, partial [Polyangiaceae bacterium]|nr:hypothetical protein [Polyangiaceae bacterium]
ALDPDLLNRPRVREQPAKDAPFARETAREAQAVSKQSGVPAPSAPPAAASPARAERTVPLLELGPLVSLGAIPSPSFGASVSGGFERGRWRAFVTGAFFPSVRKELPRTNAAAAFELRSLSAALCWLVPLSPRWGLGPCAATEFGSVAARGEGVDFPAGETKRWGATGAGGMVRFESQRSFEVGLQGIVAVPWGRPTFRVAQVEAYQPAVLTLGLRAFAGVRF